MRSKLAIGFLSLLSVVAAWAQRPEPAPRPEVMVAQGQIATPGTPVDSTAKDASSTATGPSDLERYALLLAGVGAVLFLVSRRERD